MASKNVAKSRRMDSILPQFSSVVFEEAQAQGSSHLIHRSCNTRDCMIDIQKRREVHPATVTMGRCLADSSGSWPL